MLQPTDPLHLPAPPADPPRPAFPVIASVAPLVASGAIWAVTGSASVLLFAALGPVIAVATLLDGRRGNRRARRRDLAAYERALGALRGDVEVRQVALREAARRRAPAAAAILSGRADGSRWDPGSDPLVSLGSGTIPSGMRVEPGAAGEREAALRELAGTLGEAPVVVDPRRGLGIVGPIPVARAVARGFLVQLAHALPPDATGIAELPSAGWEWAERLPHAQARSPSFEIGVREAAQSQSQSQPAPRPVRGPGAAQRLTLALAEREAELTAGCGTVLHVHGPERAEIVRSPDHAPNLPVRPELVTECEAARFAGELSDRAGVAGLLTIRPTLPGSVTLGQLCPAAAPAGAPGRPPHAAPASAPGRPPHADPASAPGRPPHVAAGGAPGPEASGTTTTLACPIGLAEGGPLWLDLVRQGPHAVVGGTTGSGKSELLVSWIASMAAGYPPTAVTFLLVDFKGGAAFRPLVALPHCVGLVTDLDEREAARALESLGAELRFRERMLREAGARDVADAAAAGALPRLVIVVDEFQAMLESFGGLHALFLDIAARGRSLGIHLILCTQRPSGVVRDALLANCSLRLSLRVNNRADSLAVIGTDAAAALSPAEPGRCLVDSGTGPAVLCQIAATIEDEIRAISSRAAAHPPARRPWLAPLPARVTLAQLLAADAEANSAPAASGARHAARNDPPGLLLGLVDEPAQQRHRVVRYDPAADGHLVVIGGARSGKSTLLAALAGQYAAGSQIVPPEVDAAWDALRGAVDSGERDRLFLFDDFDSVYGRWDPDYQAAALELLTRVLRDGPSAGLHVVIALQRLAAPLHPLQSLCPGALLLKLPTRQEHLAAGGAGSLYDPGAPPGRGSWQGSSIQVPADPDPVLPPRPRGDTAPPLFAPADRPLLVVSGAPARAAARLRAATGAHLIELAGQGGGAPLEVTDAAAGTILVGDPDSWQSHWPLLTALRTRADLVFDGCGLADYRLISRRRELPPALAPGLGQVWVLGPGEDARRATLP